MIWYLDSTPVQKNQECAVPLGVQGDNQTLRYTADVSDWLALWPSGVVALVLQPPDKSEPYMANTAIDRSTGILTWTITEFDTAIVGYGLGELRIVEGDLVRKSYRFATYIRPSILTTAADPPAPVPDWITALLETASEVQGLIDTAEEALDTAQQAITAAQAAQAATEAAQASAEESAQAAQNSRVAAEFAANEAYTSAERAEQAAQEAGFVDFYIDDDGHLIYQRTDNVTNIDFEMRNGRLIAVWQ
jgi:hypothetical protein